MGTAATGYTAGMTAPATLRHPLPTPPIAGHAPGGPRDIDVLLQWDREHVWHAFTQMQEYEPLLIERGEGCWLVDADGNRLDEHADEHEDAHEAIALEVEPVPVVVVERQAKRVVIAPGGELKPGDRVATTGGYQLFLAWKAQAEGGGGHHHDHDH